MQGNGESETMIGKLGLPSEFGVATKARTGIIEGAAKSENVLKMAQESWDALGVSKVGNR